MMFSSSIVLTVLENGIISVIIFGVGREVEIRELKRLTENPDHN